jgi:hypothetical protein
MTETHFWVGVVSKEQVRRGVELGIAQLNHGKRTALARMHQGDWLIYYSPRTSYPSGTPLQAFTAIGQITSEVPYQVTLSDGFQAFRHTVRYLPCRQVPIQEVLEDLTFLPDKQHWGARFRFGHLAVPGADFQQIARAMDVHIPDSMEGADATLSL